MVKRGSVIIAVSVFMLVASLSVIAIDAVYLLSSPNSPITGRASDVGIISLFILPPEINIQLYQGWNFVSFYANMSNYTLVNVLEPIEGDYQYVQEWNSNNQDFKVWSREGQKEFTTFDMNKSYFIYMLQDRVLNITGEFFINFTINLTQGWETPNYIYFYSSNITGNQFYNASFDYFQKWDIPSQEFMVNSPLASSQPFSTIEPAEGYFIRTEGGTIVYVKRT